MSSVIVVDKKSLDQSTVSGSRIVLETASKVHTQLYRSDVAEFVQDGNDLILKLKNGKTIVIVNFFVEHDDETSDVLFKDDNGIPWLPLLLGGAGVAGGLALASGGGGDNNGGVASAPKNHVPVAGLSNQPIETQEDQPKKGQITDVTDKDGDKLTYKVGEAPKNGTVTVDEKTGGYTYTPKSGVTGDDKFTVVVSDGKGGEVTVTVPVTVTPVNDAPKLDDAEVTVKQGVKDPIVHNVNDASTGKDEDVDGDKLTYAITKGNEDGLFVIDPNTGVITLAHGKMLDHGKAPLHKLEVTATDSSSDKLSSTATITINVSNDSKITTEITPQGEITGTTDNVEKGPVKLTITGTDKNGQPVTIERTVELDRPDGSSEGKYTYQLTPKDGIVDGSKVTVEAKTVDRQGDTIHANTELPGYLDEETPGLDLVVPTIEITQVATDEKVTWGEEGKEGFEVKGTTTGVEAGQSVTVTFDKTVDGQPVTVEATVGKDGSWTAKITPEQAAKLLEGSVSATVKDIAGNEKSAEAVEYTIDAPTAVVTGYGDNIENVLNTVEIAGEVSKTVTISSEIDPNLANDTTKTMMGERITGDHGTFTLDVSGKWTYTLNPGEATSQALIDSKGPLTEIFTVKDSEDKSYEVKVSINDRVENDGENVVVSATTSSLQDPSNVNSDQGAYTIYTNDSLGEITGTTSQGVEKVRVYVNKQAAGTDEEMDSLGYPQYFEVAVKDGKWSLSEQNLTDGLQKTWWADQLRNDDIYLQVRAVDPTTGKVGDVSEKYTFVVDTVAPEATYVNYADGQVTALVSGDPADAHRAATGNDVIVKYTDTDGNVQVVTGKVGDKAVADKPYLSISVAVKDPSKVDSATDFKVYVKDSAGNIGVNNDSKENPLKIELPTPQVDKYHDNVNNVSGTEIIGNTGYSDDPSGLISGTIVLTEADLKVVDSVRVYLYDNRQNWIEIDKNDLVKESGDTYRWTTKPGDLSKVTTTGKLAEGEVKFYAATYDKESGSLSELSPPFKVTIDVTAPEITIESIAEDGIVSQSEKDKGFSIKGSATGVEEGNTVTVDFNGKTYEGKVSNVVSGKGEWEIKVPTEDSKGLIDEIEKNAIARVTDKAGNTSDPAEKVVKVYSKVLAKTDLITIDEDHGVMKGEIKGTESWVKYKLLTSIPSEVGTLEFIGDEYSGHFNFTPVKDWSGKVEFDVLVEDYYGHNRTVVTQVIDIVPIADKPVLNTEVNFDVGELSLNKYTWNNIAGYKQIGDQWYDFRAVQTTGSGINPTVLVNGINALFEHQRPVGELTNEMKSEGWSESEHGWGLPESGAVYMNGYVYLEAGKDYKYTGSADDNGLIIIGDNESSKYVSWQGLPSTTTETFTVKESGFYTFNLYIYNESEKGNYNFKVTEADGTDVKYFPSVEAIKGELGKDVHLAEEMTGKDGKGFYGVSFGYTGSENDDVELTDIVASLTDRDGSETLSLTLTGLVKGTKLIYTSVDKDGGVVTSEATADSHGTITVKGGANVTDFKDLSLDLPQGIATGKLPVTMTVTATEQGNGDAKSVTNEFTVTVNPPVAARMMATGESEEDNTTDEHVTKIELLEDNNTGGHSLEKVINFAINQSEESSEPSKIEFSEDFFNGLIHQDDLTVENLPNISQYFSLQHNAEDQTVILSVDRDGVDDHYQQEELLLLTNQPTEISLEELLNNHQIVIG
ncbi:BapA prefix-like domain-containing protein [Wohlfahrtiimonas chitiniclastica]|uniref:Ig-like domain-containing protein n=1 Tax=Wohlfahrtiimonas chitiniclastica TaxID=400946 RepID=UPI001BCFE6A9|nr:Ig-like domain-containing protein [Wohlfahrtiimonas chitiniclastica]MBS7828033.1 BapA prefix-like domain-containing protein [Wohlfahrtiimonas chitiniclastica]